MDRKVDLRFFRSVYRLLLNLYPQEFIDEYREEVQAVFDVLLEDATQKGKIEPAAVVIRELLGLPGAIVHEHLRQRRKVRMINKLSARFDFISGSFAETLAAMTPMLLTIASTSGIFMLLSSLPLFSGWLATGFGYLLSGLFFGLLLVGLVKGLPRWSMPYLGMLLALFSVYIFSEWIYAYYGFFDFYERSWVLGALVSQIYMWSGLIVFVFLVIIASAILPAFRQFRRDWTLLCLLVYGTGPFAVLLALDDYLWVESYILLTLLIQALGIWFYLHVYGKWKRFLILFTGLTLSMWTVGISKVILAPSQPWFRGNALDWWGPEMMSPVIMWVCLALALLLPTMIHFFPKIRKPVPAG